MATSNDSAMTEISQKGEVSGNPIHDTADVEPEKVESQDQKGQALKPQITQEHHDYLMKRHGTTELHPLPSMHDEDPYNWPSWKVHRLFPYPLVPAHHE